MRVSEWIDLVVFAFLTGLAWKRKLPIRRRAIVSAFGLTAIAATLLAAHFGSSIVRDWTPAVLILMVYWQAGQFFTAPDERFQKKLLAQDRRMVLPLVAHLSANSAGRLFLTSVELAYLFCYPMVPAAMAAVYLLHARAEADRFWTVVLLSTYSCYLMVPFIQTLPPRSLTAAPQNTPPLNPVRKFNLWILSNASIQMNTFPSAHVAASLACALMLYRISVPAGGAFLAVAIGIALGAVLGRYHYAADVLLGAFLAFIFAAIL